MDFAYTNFLKEGEVKYQRIWIAENYDALISHAEFCRAENESTPKKISLPLEEILKHIVSSAPISRGSLNHLESYFSKRQVSGVIGIVQGEVFSEDKESSLQ